MKRVKKEYTLVGLVAVLALAMPSLAAPLYYTDFTGTDGTDPAGWVDDANNRWQIESNDYAQTNASAGLTYYNGLLDNGQPLSSLAGTAYTVVAHIQYNQAVGGGGIVMGLKASPLRFIFAQFTGGNTFQLTNSWWSPYQTVTGITGFAAGQTWRMELEYNGTSTYTGRLYDPTGTLKATVSTSTFTPTADSFGLRAGSSSVNHLKVVDYSVVPEPATLCLLGAGAMALVRRRRS